MLNTLRAHLAGNIVGYVALFFALSGSAYAVAALAPNSVGSPQIKNKTILRADLAPSAVTKANGKWIPGPKFTEGASGTPLLKIKLDPGSYVILGKFTIVVNDARSYDCTLSAGAGIDKAHISSAANESHTQTVTLTLLHVSASEFDAALECPDGTAGDPRDTVTDVKLVGVRIAALDNSKGP